MEDTKSEPENSIRVTIILQDKRQISGTAMMMIADSYYLCYFFFQFTTSITLTFVGYLFYMHLFNSQKTLKVGNVIISF